VSTDRVKAEVREFVLTNFLFGTQDDLPDDASFLDQGIVDSTGILELVAHLQERYGITIDDTELIPDNLDSIASIAEFVTRKRHASELA
jgi:acyl carrier protein